MPVYTTPSQSITVTAVTPYNGSVSGTPLQMARDFLAYYPGEYIFFRYSELDYVCILPASSAVVTYGTDYISVDGSFSVFEIEQVYGVNGAGSTYSSLYYDAPFEDLYISNPYHFVLYASSDIYPKLIEGSVMYEYAQTALFGGCILFVLISRIFKLVRTGS